MEETPEQRYERIIRWMRDNMRLVAGVYRTIDKKLALNPKLTLDAHCAVLPLDRDWPNDCDDWMLNSVTGLVCCCYIHSLGKVMTLWKGGSDDEERVFKKFANCLPGFRDECDRGRGSLGALYATYRNGFVHNFAPGVAGWCREESRIYWCDKHGSRMCVNVGQLAYGFLEALDVFDREFRKEAATDAAKYDQFAEWLQSRIDVPRPSRQEDELRRASRHLHYEYDMLMRAASLLASGVLAGNPMEGMVLESFLVHVRSLIDFFYPRKSAQGDDVLAKDFFIAPAKAWENIRPAISDGLERARARADKELVHLTYARLAVTPDKQEWRHLEIANEIGTRMALFLQRVEKGLLDPLLSLPVEATSQAELSRGGVTGVSTPNPGPFYGQS